ncbi:MAG: ATP-dependent protease ATPase subunit HslU [Atribacterota bacterium]|nr:ATP-dependent protease ATPase subunit HslU [Atribacterota bacterium]MDD3031049.1 ATP-dependent protease ATPase subunit HslU [Atribacterota bacterium]MDD3640210.1 ATP-dependent protease ATPase subunit HslU [Atribacterota bacterium]MDD4288516.1 ATP-dependent protease ATPase subunit HslU [Atribacterota bacterium]MDD4764246.1 ATP-dependent protease ATPase subunit HslU [Atribacterota bacterium]
MIKDLVPSEIVKELDKYIVGQKKAKETVAIALRNRIRRKKLPKKLIDEVTPKNIIMIGSTGVGKTEIARRLAKIVKAPFIKVEATKFTEVGYVGKDVDSMIRDLVQAAVHLVRNEKIEKIRIKAKERVEDRILQYLLPSINKDATDGGEIANFENENTNTSEKNYPEENTFKLSTQNYKKERLKSTREKLRDWLRKGRFEDKMIEIEITEQDQSSMEFFSNMGMEGIGINFKDIMDRMLPNKKKRQKIKVSEARNILLDDEIERMLDTGKIAKEAIQKTEELGIVFIDEIDKIAMKEKSYGPDVSRSGVQRDILPIIEGSSVVTKYGVVKTDHILFIAAGAFNSSKPSDLIPELQGRFPLRVELNNLTQEDLEKILKEPDNSLIKQYKALLKTEGIELVFQEEAIKELAKMAAIVNQQNENIGARRLYTVLEKLLERISFNAPIIGKRKIAITEKYVKNRLQNVIQKEDLSKYIL